MRRSTDGGKTWGPLTRQVGSVSNLDVVNGIDYTNPSVINVRLPSGKTRVLCVLDIPPPHPPAPARLTSTVYHHSIYLALFLATSFTQHCSFEVSAQHAEQLIV
jgi:hypothetical protein